MWPWEAAVFGYLLYSLYCHGRYREAPDGWAVILVAVAAVLPDVIDKPLDWQFGVFANGYALGHSVFFGVPVALASYAVASRLDRPRLGTAFGVGFLSHVFGDSIEHMVHGRVWFGLEHMLWPVVTLPPSRHADFSGTVVTYLSEYLHEVLALHPTPYLLLVSAIVVLVVPLWLYDGCPGLREVRVGLTLPVLFVARRLGRQ